MHVSQCDCSASLYAPAISCTVRKCSQLWPPIALWKELLVSNPLKPVRRYKTSAYLVLVSIRAYSFENIVLCLSRIAIPNEAIKPVLSTCSIVGQFLIVAAILIILLFVALIFPDSFKDIIYVPCNPLCTNPSAY